MSEPKDVSRRQFIGSVGAVAAAVTLSSCEQSQNLTVQKISGAKPRNIIYVLSDDHRYDCMGFMGKPKFLETPNMDRMAAEGVHIQNAFVTTSLCSPSRASILTGQFSHHHGVVDNSTDIPQNTVFFPQYLQKVGYQTAFFGKWHMGHDTDAPRPGFDKWVSFKGQGEYYNPTLNIDGKQEKVEGYITDLLTDYVLHWLEKERDPERPYFIYLSHKAVHALFEPAERHKGKFDNVQIEYPKSMANTEENYRDKPRWVKEQRNSWHGVDYMYHGELDFDSFYRRYCETLLAVDESIGRVLDYLGDKEDDSTMVMYMGDNGFCFGEHGLIDKRHMYEESLRVPFLAYCPDLIKPGTKITELIQNIDVAPTVLELAGIQTPANMDGRSFVSLLKGQQVEWRDAVFYEYYWEWNFPQTPTVHGIRTDRYKYMHYHGVWDIDELYDIQNDPEEMHNLIHSPDYQGMINQLKNLVFDWLENTDGMYIPLRKPLGFRAANRDPEKKI